MLDQTTGEERGGSDEDVYIQCQYRPASQSQISFAIRLVIGPDQQHDDYGVRGLPSAAIKVSRSSSTFEAPGRRRAQRAGALARSRRDCLYGRSVGRRPNKTNRGGVGARRARRRTARPTETRHDRDATGNQRSISHARWNRILRAAGRREPRALRRRGHRYFAGAPTLPEKKCKTFAPLDQTPI